MGDVDTTPPLQVTRLPAIKPEAATVIAGHTASALVTVNEVSRPLSMHVIEQEMYPSAGPTTPRPETVVAVTVFKFTLHPSANQSASLAFAVHVFSEHVGAAGHVPSRPHAMVAAAGLRL